MCETFDLESFETGVLIEVPSSINEEDKIDWVRDQSTLLHCDKSFSLLRRCELKTLLNVLALLQINKILLLLIYLFFGLEKQVYVNILFWKILKKSYVNIL